MSFTDPRLPGREYKTERGLKSAVTALEKRLRGTEEYFAAFPESSPTSAPMCSICGSIRSGDDCSVCDSSPSTPALSEQDAQTELLALRAQIAATAAADQAELRRVENAPYSGPIFLRNLRAVPVRLRFGGKEGRTVNLQPRGQRGDFDRLRPGEEYDSQLNDIGVLFEVLTDTQIAKVIHGQTTNQQAVHPALAMLRSPTGEQYRGEVVIEEEFSEQGFTVGTVVTPGQDEKQSRVVIGPRQPEIDLAVGPARAPMMGTQDRPVPVVSGSVPPEDQGAYVQSQGGLQALMHADAIARQKSADGPRAGLGGLRVATPFGLDSAPVVETRFDAQIDPSQRDVIVAGGEV